MKLMETVGMMSTGALFAIGAIYLFSPAEDAPLDSAPVPELEVSAPTPPEAELAEPAAPVGSDAPEAREAREAQVARATVNLSDVSPVNQIETIVALSEEGIDQTEELTPEQQEVVAFFEATARKMNESDRDRSGGGVQFSNMAVSKLHVRYFYTVPGAYDPRLTSSIMAEQTALVGTTLCAGEAIRTLMQEYGFRYTYTYVSADNRLIGKVNADASTCG